GDDLSAYVNDTTKNVGTRSLPVILAGVDKDNYQLQSANTSITITKRDLVVYVNDQAKQYGLNDPSYTLDLNDANDPLGAFTVNYTRESGQTIGEYTINATVTNANYNITVMPGTLTINPREITVT